jgi:hypothetical protein
MKIRELIGSNILVSLTNEESNFLKNYHSTINLASLTEREIRVAESLLYKDVLCKISETQLMVKTHESDQYTSNR